MGKNTRKKTLPKWLTTVTPLSKIVALSLFVTLPLATFGLGWKMRENQPEDLTRSYSFTDAVEAVKQRKDVRDWLATFGGPEETSLVTGGRPVFALDGIEAGKYVIHVFEETADRNVTFNRYRVDIKTGYVTEDF
jgi:hypothetical protein